MATFMQVTKRMNTNIIGEVTGSAWVSAKYPKAYLGFAEVGKGFLGMPKVDRTKLMIYGVDLEDFIFGKEDIASATIIEEKAAFRMGNQTIFGPKYKIDFVNGKTAIIHVGSADAYKIDSILY